jgi:hypothetical protein
MSKVLKISVFDLTFVSDVNEKEVTFCVILLLREIMVNVNLNNTCPLHGYFKYLLRRVIVTINDEHFPDISN